MSSINIIGTWTLYLKEVNRFLKVYNQTILAPVITSLLFLAVFNLALGNNIHKIGNIYFNQFMAAGLVMMAVVQNAFANTSSSFIMGKVLGIIIDYLIPPISTGELIFAMVMAGITRGLFVGILVLIALFFFIPIHINSYFFVIFYLLTASMLLALLGLLAGIISETFDHMAAITAYIITPMAFLSGTFYSVENLPSFWRNLSSINPFFYMIDGFRFGLTGYHDGNLSVGIIFMISIISIIWFAVYIMIAKGYKIKN